MEGLTVAEPGLGTNLWIIPLYFTGTVALVVVILALSSRLGGRHHGHDTDQPYESGVPVTGSARVRFGVQFYIIAMVFLIFDVETVFILSWAVAGRTLGRAAYIELAVFVVLLLAALFYLARVGALDWRRSTASRRGDR